MQQEGPRDMKIHIYIVKKDGCEEKVLENVSNDYNHIMKVLVENQNSFWKLFDFESGTPIDQTNIENFNELSALRISDIPQLIQNSQSFSDLNQQVQKLQGIHLDLQYANDQLQFLNTAFPNKSIEGTQRNVEKQNLEIEKQKCELKLKEKEKMLLNEEQTLEKFKQRNLGLNRKLEVEQEKNKNLSCKNNTLEEMNTQLDNLNEELKKKSNELSREIEGKRQIIDDLSKELQQNSQEINDKSIRIGDLQKELEQKKQEIYDQTIQIEDLSKKIENYSQELMFLKSSSNLQQTEINVNQQNEEGQSPQKDLCLNKIQTNNSSQYEDQQNKDIQIKFLQSMLQKSSKDIKEARQIIYKKKDKSLMETQVNQNLLYQITLNEQFFTRNIKENNVFFRDSCIEKMLIQQISKIQPQMTVNVVGQIVNIKKAYTSSKSETEALDLILNILIVSGYFKLFLSHLQEIDIQKNWKLKIPRQFLVKDDQDIYHVYQECLNIETKNFKTFENTSNVDHFVSSFFKYIYYATNQNIALTECQLGEQEFYNQQKEIVIQSVIIHSHFQQLFSILDEGKNMIEIFKSKEETNLVYWSKEMKNLAKNVWKNL